MANMGYCRFENTYHDLLDCLYHINDDLSETELIYRNKLINACKDIIEETEWVKDDEWEGNE